VAKKIIERKKLKFIKGEIFKEISLGEDDGKLKRRYAISNYGRFVSFTDEIEYGQFIKGGKQDGYNYWQYMVRDENNKNRYKHRFFYRLVAEYFLPKTSESQVYVLHLNYNRGDDYYRNLQWATRPEMIAHGKKSPHVIAYRKKQAEELRERSKHQGKKLSSTQVMRLKKILLDPTRKIRMKILARQFNVTEMQLYRIKSGQNWGHIKVKINNKNENTASNQ
jgi:hypothetical protein